MNINFEYYKIFYYVAKYHNFTKAAQVLESSQPNVTRAMNCLEQQMHSTLFVRTNRGVQLTPEGEKLYMYVSAAMHQLLTAEEELADYSGMVHGSISIGASETALNIYLFDKLRSFHTAYPGIRLRIYNHSTPEAVDAVKSGKIDFAVVSTLVEADSPLETRMLRSFREILIGGQSFKELQGKTLSLKELKNYPLISLGRETMTFRFYERLFLSYGIEFAPDTEAATTDQILPLVRCELGLAFIPESMAGEALERGEVIQAVLKEKIPDRHICMIYDSQHPLNTAARSFRRLLEEDCEKVNTLNRGID